MNRHDAAGPEQLALLPQQVVSRYLTDGVRSGSEVPPIVALQRASKPLSDTGARWATAHVRRLLDVAMERFDGRPTQADAWLAPRLHATIRMTRAEAAEPELWAFLAMVVAPDYVVWRHKGTAGKDGSSPAATVDRFFGPHYKQAFARLWWAAEMFRDGEDYRPVVVACGTQDMVNSVLRLSVIDHRPTARALVRVLENLTAVNASVLGDRMNAVSSAVNAAGSTLMYEVIAPDSRLDVEDLMAWIKAAEDEVPVDEESLPDGPNDGAVPRAAVDTLTRYFEELAAEAPIRDRKRMKDGDQ
ncbi:DUF6339 family protein [Streptomyces sp. UNOC14_S4]|uniref:DUF6339 family protein n=1 Tax=Streptomyces sp. UNOC14_S4 TaxID=2872340 RepID=UPI001E3C4DA0|nr:DUF6339 family protein [Streptomyces sp. UNOC14_S4]MCC3767193.1 hypothetical protein [Streptomyces sp. UNOC14_S4]